MSVLKTLIINPRSGVKPTATLFFLHGLGDSSAGWSDVAQMLSQRPSLSHVRFVLPDAPIQPVTLNMGMPMPSWFDILSLDDISGAEDEAGMLKSADEIKKLIKAENDGTAQGLDGQNIPSERIVVGGFSQGGAISLLIGLTNPNPVAGVAALSTWLPLRAKIATLRTPTSTSLKVFQAHGDADQVVKYEYGQRTVSFLKNELGLNEQDVEWHTYPRMPHSACPEEIRDLAVFLEKVIPAQ
ncbi:related to lysophospholipase [Sporisorium reilianum f. sp. reilianum]|uniref:Acyl-protein thioesterase 1 n=1 Tax=Sporisorium reilianum f. sp. reilianum TaxID=72559 RepID=A0A2N8U637_9BASI|nr:related to lysophospholipase [Sporisorium reilianum f. sp. reilianum]